MKNFLFLFSFFVIKYLNCDTAKKSCFEYSCKECESEEYGKCTKCREGFNLIEGTCPCTNFQCALCTGGSYYDDCELCKNGYYNNNKNCNCEIEGCAICENNICLVCYDEYVLDISNNKCDLQTNEKRRNCYDPNCDVCLSEEKGTCEECKKGFNLKKGECYELKIPEPNKTCEQGYYENDGVCEPICNGFNCNSFFCFENQCLRCNGNRLNFIYPCDYSKFCTKEGCSLCYTDDDCYFCNQGYYLVGGICQKCIKGCSVCVNNETCQYCLSGYKLDSNSKCIANLEHPDFNINLYQKIKFKLISKNFPNEYNMEEAQKYANVKDCDTNCKKCDENSAICLECKADYELIDNKCENDCSDENCLHCSKGSIEEKCIKCKDGFVANGKNCYLKCSDENCRYCTKINDQEICTECLGDYQLNGFKCELKTNYLAIIYTVIVFLVIAIFIICFCWYKQKKIQETQEIIRSRIRNGIAPGPFNNVEVYNRNIDESSSVRKKLTREEILEEFEKQKVKSEKGDQVCQYCKKKPGKYKCDCECIVCKEHSQLKKEEGDGETYKVCYNCGKVVKKVTPIKTQCNICFGMKMSVFHFNCNCALVVCKDCYIKCKLENDKCPGCRAKI